GYISHAAAKSVVGGRSPEFGTVHNRAGGFFYALSTAPSQWWTVWGSRKARRMFRPVLRTLHSSPPKFRSDGGGF
ncbi:hypothetical protein, partial [Yersinia enterocolitica]|uniref:hypothetical protein n=1 Tax=Yersinia enterocolitica TaxID=630 RepID=UPI001C60BB10